MIFFFYLLVLTRSEAALPHCRMGGMRSSTGKTTRCVCVVSSPDVNGQAASFLSTGTLLAYREDCRPEGDRWKTKWHGRNGEKARRLRGRRKRRERVYDNVQKGVGGVGGLGWEGRKRALRMESGISERNMKTAWEVKSTIALSCSVLWMGNKRKMNAQR